MKKLITESSGKQLSLFSLTNVDQQQHYFIRKKMKLSMTTKKFPTPLTSISQILPKA